MLRFRLEHYNTGSVITCLDHETLEHVGAITYTRNIHKYESESDYNTITTELNTYGDDAAYEIFAYFKTSRQNIEEPLKGRTTVGYCPRLHNGHKRIHTLNDCGK